LTSSSRCSPSSASMGSADYARSGGLSVARDRVPALGAGVRPIFRIKIGFIPSKDHEIWKIKDESVI
jgi:hypothetical protein